MISVTGIASRVLRPSTGVLAVLLSAAFAAAAPAEDKIGVASKIDTDGALLGNMAVALLDHHGLAVENRLQPRPTNIARAAILSAQIDLYREYTGDCNVVFYSEMT